MVAQALQGGIAPEVVTLRKTHTDRGVETQIDALRVMGVETHVVTKRSIVVRLR